MKSGFVPVCNIAATSSCTCRMQEHYGEEKYVINLVVRNKRYNFA